MSHTVGRMREVTLPTGTVTFLMTDIEGSTRGWSRSPAALTAAVPRHYQILDDAIVAHGGVRPVEQGEGDSVVAAFSRASDAVHAALLAQRSLTAEQWLDGVALKVRMAVHTGEAQLRDEANYCGGTDPLRPDTRLWAWRADTRVRRHRPADRRHRCPTMPR